jgi:DNA adenine methylase
MGYTTSPLRYPGGKTRLANFIKQIIIANELTDGDYVEPYAGGAGIAWSLLFQDYVKRVHINDINRPVYAFWHSVFEETDGLCRLIRDTSVTMKSWHQQRAIYDRPKGHSILEVGFSAFFLNRTNRSGIIWGGVIGGKSQAGKWKLNARYNKRNLIKRIEKIAQYADRVRLYRKDAAEFIKQVVPRLSAQSLVYLDPPYYCKGAGLYEDYYTHEDHVTIAKLVAKSINQKWMVTYDDTPKIRDLYSEYEHLVYQLSYSAADRYSGSEVMFFCPTLIIPKVESPLGIKAPKNPRPIHALPNNGVQPTASRATRHSK